LDKDPVRQLGLTIEPQPLPPVIGGVLPGAPAERAGFRKGDRIVAIDGRPIDLWSEVARAARSAPDRLLRFSVDRDGQRLAIEVGPERIEDKEQRGAASGRIGFSPQDVPALREAMFTTVSYAPGAAIGKAVAQTWETSVFTLRMIGRMLTGEL